MDTRIAASLVAQHLNEMDGVAEHPYAPLDPALVDEAKSDLESTIEFRGRRGDLLNKVQRKLIGRHGEIKI